MNSMVASQEITDNSSEADCHEIASRVKKDLTTSGYSVYRTPVGYETFRKVAELLGTIWHRTEVRVDPQSKWRASSGAALSLHTDNPYANIVAWFCETPGPLNEPTLLVNLRDAIDNIDDDDAKRLNEILIPIPSFDDYAFTPEPLLERTEDRGRLNYLDWLEASAPLPEHQTALTRFKDIVSEKERREMILVHLQRGQLLFVDNNTMLHGRQKLMSSSPRTLIRLWINNDKRRTFHTGG